METPKATCENCGKRTDISEATAYKQMKIKCQVAMEELKFSEKGRMRTRKNKAGQINAMHLMIKKLYQLLNPGQREKATQLSQELRDEFKHIERMN